MARATYIASPCKTALNRVSGMPFSWSLNPYRGCVHACHYCYARATHAYYGLDAGSDFETRIFVKTNLVEVLRRELARPSWRGERVAIGTATDPYQPCEGRYRLTRGALEALRDHANPVGIVTKSTLVLRDLDRLIELGRVADVAVSFTITTLDAATWRAVEPGTPPPIRRLEVMRRLVEAGVRCGVLLAPILPGITDAAASLDAVAGAAKAHGAAWLWAAPLRLAPLVKEHYLGFVGDAYPHLAARYERAYGGVDAPPDYRAALQARLDRIRRAHGFAEAERLDRDDPPRRVSVASDQASPRQRALPI